MEEDKWIEGKGKMTKIRIGGRRESRDELGRWSVGEKITGRGND